MSTEIFLNLKLLQSHAADDLHEYQYDRKAVYACNQCQMISPLLG